MMYVIAVIGMMVGSVNRSCRLLFLTNEPSDIVHYTNHKHHTNHINQVNHTTHSSDNFPTQSRTDRTGKRRPQRSRVFAS